GAICSHSNIPQPTPAKIPPSTSVYPLTVNNNIRMAVAGTLKGNSLGNVMRIRANSGLVSQSTPSAQVFLNPSQFGTPRTVTSNTLGLAGVTNLTASNATLLDLDLGPISSTLAAAAVIPINAAFSALDTSLITPLVHR